MNNHPYGGSRFVQIEVLKKCLWSPALLQKIADIVSNFKTSYAVEYSQDIEDECLGVNFLVVSSDQIVAYFSSEDEARAFGVSKLDG